VDDTPLDDVQLVTDTYEQCWQQSRGRYNSWIEGRLDPLARRFYIVVNATERCLMDGVPSLLGESRFTLAETAEAYESFGFSRHAAVIRELAGLVDDTKLSRDRRERARQVNEVEISSADTDRLNQRFPMSQAEENEVWRGLAKVIREHPERFAAAEQAWRRLGH
jgi:hypothetical protein